MSYLSSVHNSVVIASGPERSEGERSNLKTGLLRRHFALEK